MKNVLLLLLIFQCLVGFVFAETALITLDRGFTWKAMFDAGFRPFYTGDGINKCRQLNVRVQVRKQEGGEILDLGIGDIEFTLRDDHLLVLVSFYGREYRAVADAEEKSEVFASVFGDTVNQKSKIAWFETKHSEDYGGQKIDPPQIIRQVDDKDASNHAQIGDLSIFYSFKSVNIKATPMAERFSVSLKSHQAYNTPSLETKIQPPAGYEYVSLEPNEVLKSQKTKMSSEDPSNLSQANGREGTTAGRAFCQDLLLQLFPCPGRPCE
jgi:hypothetical protein